MPGRGPRPAQVGGAPARVSAFANAARRSPNENVALVGDVRPEFLVTGRFPRSRPPTGLAPPPRLCSPTSDQVACVLAMARLSASRRRRSRHSTSPSVDRDRCPAHRAAPNDGSGAARSATSRPVTTRITPGSRSAGLAGYCGGCARGRAGSARSRRASSRAAYVVDVAALASQERGSSTRYELLPSQRRVLPCPSCRSRIGGVRSCSTINAILPRAARADARGRAARIASTISIAGAPAGDAAIASRISASPGRPRGAFAQVTRSVHQPFPACRSRLQPVVIA